MATPESQINVLGQLGFESGGFGAGGAAGYALQSLLVEPGDELQVNEYSAQGHRLDTVTVINKQWSAVKVSGPALYTEALLAVENFLGTVSPSTPSGAVATRKRIYDLLLTGGITPRSWVGQFGDPNENVNSYAGAFLTDFGLKYNRDSGVTLDALAGLAQIINPAAGSFTASPVYLPNFPIAGSHVNYYIDNTGAALGTTQISDEVLDFAWSVKGLKGPRWVSDRTYPSFKGYTDVKPKTAVSIALAESSVTRALVATLRAGSTIFVRANCQGPLVDNLQTVTITGAPTGGTFTLSYKGQTTGALAYNDAATGVQTALDALSTIGAGNATVTGGAGGPYEVAFVGTLAQDTTLLTATEALTGGTSPNVAIAANPFYYLLNADVAVRVTKIGAYGKSNEGVYMRTIDGIVFEDDTWGHGLMLTSQTGIATL